MNDDNINPNTPENPSIQPNPAPTPQPSPVQTPEPLPQPLPNPQPAQTTPQPVPEPTPAAPVDPALAPAPQPTPFSVEPQTPLVASAFDDTPPPPPTAGQNSKKTLIIVAGIVGGLILIAAIILIVVLLGRATPAPSPTPTPTPTDQSSNSNVTTGTSADGKTLTCSIDHTYDSYTANVKIVVSYDKSEKAVKANHIANYTYEQTISQTQFEARKEKFQEQLKSALGLSEEDSIEVTYVSPRYVNSNASTLVTSPSFQTALEKEGFRGDLTNYGSAKKVFESACVTGGGDFSGFKNIINETE